MESERVGPIRRFADLAGAMVPPGSDCTLALSTMTELAPTFLILSTAVRWFPGSVYPKSITGVGNAIPGAENLPMSDAPGPPYAPMSLRTLPSDGHAALPGFPGFSGSFEEPSGSPASTQGDDGESRRALSANTGS